MQDCAPAPAAGRTDEARERDHGKLRTPAEQRAYTEESPFIPEAEYIILLAADPRKKRSLDSKFTHSKREK